MHGAVQNSGRRWDPLRMTFGVYKPFNFALDLGCPLNFGTQKVSFILRCVGNKGLVHGEIELKLFF